MKIKSKRKRSVTLAALIATVICAVFASFAGIFGASVKTANATATGTSYAIGNGGSFNASSLTILMGKIMGSSTAKSYNDLKAYMDKETVRTGSEIDAQVTLGGEVWNVVYASETKGGDVIATLWLAESEDLQQWNNWYADESKNWDFPSNMYSSSYIRGYLTGSSYAKSSKNGIIAEKDYITLATGDQSSEWSAFITQYSDFICTPSEVAWQETESAVLENFKWNYPNDAYGIPSKVNWYSAEYDYTLKAGYGDWQSDKMWLPSFTETGYNYIVEGHYTSYSNGIWNISVEDRQNSASPSWLRSGVYYPADGACALDENGGYKRDFPNTIYAVRPAFHLNLKTAAAAAGLTVDAPQFASTAGVTLLNNNTVATATYKEDLTVNLTTIPAGVSVYVDSTAVSGNSFKITSAGTHTVTMTPKAGYSWSDGSLGAKTLTVTVAKATYDMSNVKWTEVTEFNYDGAVHKVELTGLPDGVTAIYSDNSASAAGSYTATVSFIYDSENYSAPNVTETSCVWTITSNGTAAPVSPNDPIIVQQGLSGGAIAGIVIASILAVIAILTAIIAIIVKNKNTQIIYDGGFYDKADE